MRHRGQLRALPPPGGSASTCTLHAWPQQYVVTAEPAYRGPASHQRGQGADVGSRVYGPTRARGTILFWGVILPAVAIAVIFSAGQGLMPAVSAMVRPGEPGTFTAEKQDCRGVGRSRSCLWHGDWVSDDGKRSRTNVRLVGDDVRVHNAGDRVDARDSGNPAVYADRHIGSTLGAIVIIMGAVALLVVCGRIIWRLRKEQMQLRVNRTPRSR